MILFLSYIYRIFLALFLLPDSLFLCFQESHIIYSIEFMRRNSADNIEVNRKVYQKFFRRVSEKAVQILLRVPAATRANGALWVVDQQVFDLCKIDEMDHFSITALKIALRLPPRDGLAKSDNSRQFITDSKLDELVLQ